MNVLKISVLWNVMSNNPLLGNSFNFSGMLSIRLQLRRKGASKKVGRKCLLLVVLGNRDYWSSGPVALIMPHQFTCKS
jgi:hypothetical protein